MIVLSGLKSHIEQSLDSLSYYENLSQKSDKAVETTTATGTAKILDEETFSEQFDIAPEELRRIHERLGNVTGERLRKEFLTLSIETSIPISILEAIHSRTVEILLRVEHPHPKDRYGNVVRVHRGIMEQLGLQRIDRAKIAFGEKEYIVTVQPLDANDDREVIKVGKIVRDVLGVNVGDTVKLERASIGVMF